MKDTQIVELFWERDERAITETQLKYGKLCLQLAKNITGDLQDAEEVVNDAYLGVWEKIPPEKPQCLKSFLCRIARNKSIDRVKYYNADKRKRELQVSLDEIEDILSGSDTPEKVFDRKETALLISDYLRSIKPDKRGMFIQRYWYYRSVADIASNFGVTENKVKTTLYRVRKELKQYLESREVIL